MEFGFPIAFTITTHSWGAILYMNQLQKVGQLQNVYSAIKWGTYYFLKYSAKTTILYVYVSFLIPPNPIKM